MQIPAPNQSLEQHFLRSTGRYGELLDACGLADRNVIEFGAGNGALTKLLADRGANVVAYEIDGSLIAPADVDADIRIESFEEADLSYLDRSWACISNPPYSHLEFVLETLERQHVYDAVLMAPERKDDLIRRMKRKGFSVVFGLPGSAFYPESEGHHLVMVRGFG